MKAQYCLVVGGTLVAMLGQACVGQEEGQQMQHYGCGTDHSAGSDHFLATVKSLHGRSAAAAAVGGARLVARDPSPVSVDTYFHIVSSAAQHGAVTQAMADGQLAALQAAYGRHGIAFALRNTSWTVDDGWSAASGDPSDPADVAMKTALRQGSYGALNLYFQTGLAGSILGRCSLPTDTGPAGAGAANAAASPIIIADGCNIQANTMPGGSVLGYNEGKTAVHETGHWLGLLHVFAENTPAGADPCDGPGDYVDDTPAQANPTDGCPSKPAKDSCPSKPGVDAIHSFLDYSTDACMTMFSPGQVQRIHDLWGLYRSGK